MDDEYLVHYLTDVIGDETACGSTDGDGSTTSEASVTCPDCLAEMAVKDWS